MAVSSALLVVIFFSTSLAHEGSWDRFRFKNVVLFGDSYTDTGNVYQMSRWKWPLSPPYFRGRYCNGPNWVDQLKVPGILNYAYGGATTDNNVVQGSAAFNSYLVPGVRQQIELYRNRTSVSQIDFARTLYILWAGGNDLLFKPTITPPEIAASLLNSVKDLLATGATNILVFNQIPAQYIPAAQALAPASVLGQLTAWFNTVLTSSLNAIQQNNTQAAIKVFDIHSLITKVVISKSDYFTNSTTNCWNPVNISTVLQLCKTPDKFVFLDKIHFTFSVHELIAHAIRDFLLPSFDVNRSNCYIR
jgi:thermolabile hemolysin